jgi:hypothetical protein
MLIDVTLFVYNALPSVLRIAFWADYLRAAFEPLRTLNNRTFLAVGYNSSVGSQELYLNRLYGNPYDVNTGFRTTAIAAQSIIYIENWSTFITPTYLYNNAEGQEPLYVYNTAEGEAPLYLYNTQEFTGAWDFKVWVPFATAGLPDYTEDKLKAQINKYLPEGRRYVIDYY